MNRKIRIALLGMCNSKNVLENIILKDKIENYFYAFQPCYIDITNKNKGLDIPYQYFYKTPIGNAYKDPFTKKTMQMDLNKTTLTSIETLNPDYLVIDLGSLNMKTWKVSYKDKSVFSRNAFAPECYKDLKITLGEDFSFEEVSITEDIKLKALTNLSNYLLKNWDLNKVILFVESSPKYFEQQGKLIEINEKNYNRQWEIKAIENTKKLSDIFAKQLNYKIKIFNDINDKIISLQKGEIKLHELPSAHHGNLETQKRQAESFKKFLNI